MVTTQTRSGGWDTVGHKLIANAYYLLSNLLKLVLFFIQNILQCNDTFVGLGDLYVFPFISSFCSCWTLLCFFVKCGAILKLNSNPFTCGKPLATLSQ